MLVTLSAQVSAGGVSKHRVPGMLAAAKASGTEFVNIGPLKDDIGAELGSTWIAPRPNTDVALMLALAFVLETEGLADHAFLGRYTTGYPRFRSYILGETDGTAKTPDWAAAITGIAPDTITTLARRMATSRTMLSMSWSLQRADHGEQAVWALVTLAAMLGQIGLPGGGFGTGYAAANRVGNIAFPFAWPAFPQGVNKVRDFIPVARLGDMLEFPGTEFDYNGGRYTYPEIKVIWWAGGNPFHHQQDLNRLHRVWKRPELVVVQEPLWNAIARHADIVLPCTLPFERNDLGIVKGEPHLVAMKRYAEAPGLAKNDYDILAGIAAEMGCAEAFTENRSELDWVRLLYRQSAEVAAQQGYNLPDFDTFWEQGEVRFEQLDAPKSLLADFRADPIGNPLRTPSGKIEIGSDRVASFGYDDCPGIATWFEPAEYLGNAPEGALHLISNQPARKLHSQLDLGSHSRAGKVAGREPARLHPTEAAKRGIKDGDVLRIWSPRGACLGGAVVTEDVAPGVVQMSTGAWLDLDFDAARSTASTRLDGAAPDAAPEAGSLAPGRPPALPLDRHGNVNVLTRDTPTSRLAMGPTAHTTLVFIEKFEGEPPAVRAFEPPEIFGVLDDQEQL